MLRRIFMFNGAAGLAALPLSFLNLLASQQAQAKIPGTVTWGGAYILGTNKELPNVAKALTLESETDDTVNSSLLSSLRKTDWQKTDIDLRTGFKRKVTRYGMVFAIAYERVLSQVYAPKIDSSVYDIRLIGYNILYDIEDRRIVACFAVRGRYFDGHTGTPDFKRIPEMYLDMFSTQNIKNNFSHYITEKITSYPYEIKYKGKSFKVDKVIGSDFAEHSANMLNIDLQSFSDEIGFVATSAFSEKLVCPIIPFEKTRALTTDLVGEMKIVATTGTSALDTSLPLAEADIGINIELDGWEFNEANKTSQRVQVTLTTSFTLMMQDKNSGEIIYKQGFFGQQDFFEIPAAKYQIERDARLFRIHEALLDRAFAAINNQNAQTSIFDGEEVTKDSEITFLQAVEEDKDKFSAQNNKIKALLPRRFGQG